jgi:hypothetical protein
MEKIIVFGDNWCLIFWWISFITPMIHHLLINTLVNWFTCNFLNLSLPFVTKFKLILSQVHTKVIQYFINFDRNQLSSCLLCSHIYKTVQLLISISTVATTATIYLSFAYKSLLKIYFAYILELHDKRWHTKTRRISSKFMNIKMEKFFLLVHARWGKKFM